MRALKFIVSMLAVVMLSLGLATPTEAAVSGDTLVAAAKASAYKSCSGYKPEPLKFLVVKKGGAVYGAILSCVRVIHEKSKLPMAEVKVAVIPAVRATTYRHKVTIYRQNVCTKAIKTKSDVVRTGTETWTYKVGVAEDHDAWATQDVPRVKRNAKSGRVDAPDHLSRCY